jgi:hypothetical protein
MNRSTAGDPLERRIQRYDEFWPYYLREHRLPATRWIHFLGTHLALGLLVAAGVTLNPWLLPGAVVSGYAFAWISHFFIEKNRPATFKYPGWSLYSDFRMLALMWTGRLGPELERAGLSSPQIN